VEDDRYHGSACPLAETPRSLSRPGESLRTSKMLPGLICRTFAAVLRTGSGGFRPVVSRIFIVIVISNRENVLFASPQIYPTILIGIVNIKISMTKHIVKTRKTRSIFLGFKAKQELNEMSQEARFQVAGYDLKTR
jgi:hypothetical protein